MIAPIHGERRDSMHVSRLALRLATLLALALAAIGPLAAQSTTPAAASTAIPASKPVTLDALKGTWVRPDGGYMIAIKSVGPEGQLDAMYFNPNPLPFAKAQALRGVSLRAFFELRAGGYAGSTYDLTYDPVNDRLRGTYYQAVAKQNFDVYFTRK